MGSPIAVASRAPSPILGIGHALSFPPRGDHGFGYDPIFIADGMTRPFPNIVVPGKGTLTLTFTGDDGEMVALLGTNGAGKSTLLRMLIAAEIPDEGQIFVQGKNVTKLKKSEIPFLRRKVGTVFQDFRLLDHLTTYENVALPLRVQGRAETSYRAEVVELPREETERRWAATTPQWPIMHAVLYGVTRDQFMGRHKANHINVAYAPDAAAANNQLLTQHPELDAGVSPVDNRKQMYLNGTSMAAPNVSGFAAVLMSRFPNYNTGLISDILVSSSKDLDTPGVDLKSGWGAPQMDVALAGPTALRQTREVNVATGGVDVWSNNIQDARDRYSAEVLASFPSDIGGLTKRGGGELILTGTNLDAEFKATCNGVELADTISTADASTTTGSVTQ